MSKFNHMEADEHFMEILQANAEFDFIENQLWESSEYFRELDEIDRDKFMNRFWWMLETVKSLVENNGSPWKLFLQNEVEFRLEDIIENENVNEDFSDNDLEKIRNFNQSDKDAIAEKLEKWGFPGGDSCCDIVQEAIDKHLKEKETTNS